MPFWNCIIMLQISYVGTKDLKESKRLYMYPSSETVITVMESTIGHFQHMQTTEMKGKFFSLNLLLILCAVIFYSHVHQFS